MTSPGNTSPTRYTGRDYASAVQELSNFIKATRPTVWTDFYESNLGSALMELLANVVDTTSWGTDAAFLEAFLATCARYESGYYFAKSVGYQPRPYTAATAVIQSQGVPATVVAYGCTIPAGSALRGTNGLSYRVANDIAVLPGTSLITIPVVEGRTETNTFAFSSTPNQAVTVNQTKVADKSWHVFVGDANNPLNEWQQVPSVLVLDSQSQSYDVMFDADGRLTVRFGDGVYGAIPQDVITVKFATCNGARGNSPASSISGSITVNVPSPTPSTAVVTFSNYSAVASSGGNPTTVIGEALGSTIASPTQTFKLSNLPAQSGSILVSIPTGGSGVLVVKDDGNGNLNVITNTTGIAFSSGVVNYSTGAVVIYMSSMMAAGNPVKADYVYISNYNPSAVQVAGAATGGADLESLDELRINIPAFIRSGGRIITFQDYTDAPKAVAGVSASLAQALALSFASNVVHLYAWGSEVVGFTSTEPNNNSATSNYTRYSQVSDAVVSGIQQYVRPRSLITVHNVVHRPLMRWVDVYLQQVRVDTRVPAQNIRQGIVDAVVNYFQSNSGVEVRISTLMAKIAAVRGVVSFDIHRFATGNRDVTSEADTQPPISTLSATIGGTTLVAPISPGTVVVTLTLNSGNICNLVDDGLGSLVVASGDLSGLTLASNGTINYGTGVWSATFTAPPGVGTVTIGYSDILADYRLDQNVVVSQGTDYDPWPPAPISDGRPRNYVAGTYPAGTAVTYEPLQDLVIESVIIDSYYFDDTVPFNNSIYYNSMAIEDYDVRRFNLRKLSFELVPQ